MFELWSYNNLKPCLDGLLATQNFIFKLNNFMFGSHKFKRKKLQLSDINYNCQFLKQYMYQCHYDASNWVNGKTTSYIKNESKF